MRGSVPSSPGTEQVNPPSQILEQGPCLVINRVINCWFINFASLGAKVSFKSEDYPCAFQVWGPITLLPTPPAAICVPTEWVSSAEHDPLLRALQGLKKSIRLSILKGHAGHQGPDLHTEEGAALGPLRLQMWRL